MKRILLIIFSCVLFSFTTSDSKSEYNVPRAAYSITTSDLNSDNDEDIIIGHLYNFSTEWSGISIMTNDGEASFQIDTSYLYDHHWDVLASKIDNNNYFDFVTQGTDNGNYAIIVWHDFVEPTNYLQYLFLNHYPDHISLGDINGDTKDDIVFWNNSDKIWGTLINDGTGNFAPPQYHDVSDYYPTDIACGDLNDDGREDIVIVGQKTEVYFSYSNGFQLLTLETNSFKGSVSIADFDNNGTKDIAASLSLYPYDYTLLKFYKNLGNNNIIVEDSIIFQPLCFGEFQVSDFNNDSLPDLLFHPADNDNLLVLFNNENFDFGDSLLIPMADYGETTRRSACADFDGNGYNDIATIRYLHAPIPNVNILFNDGNGNFWEDPITNIQHSTFNIQHSLNCYPNPFRTETTISFSVKEKEKAQLQVFDLNGKLVHTIINKELQNGKHKVKWNGTDKNGKEVEAGIYFVILNSTSKALQQTKIIKK